MGPGGPHLLSGDHPLLAVALSLGGERGQIRARTGLGEQLARDHLAAPQAAHVELARGIGSVVLDRGRDHAEADAERAVVGNLELHLELAVGAVVGTGEFASPPLLRSADPAEARVELLLAPEFGLLGVLGLLGAVLLTVEVVGALAPHELLLDRATLGDRLEELECFCAEIFEADVGHCLFSVSGGVVVSTHVFPCRTGVEVTAMRTPKNTADVLCWGKPARVV